jgi:hypothetical protein
VPELAALLGPPQPLADWLLNLAARIQHGDTEAIKTARRIAAVG